jgi:DNA-binding NtrC family response regulator
MPTRALTWTALCARPATAFEKAYFEFHLAREGGSMTRVAEKTGLERTHLYRKLRQLGVDLGAESGINSASAEKHEIFWL